MSIENTAGVYQKNYYFIKTKTADGGSTDSPDASAPIEVHDALPPAGTAFRDASTVSTALSSNIPPTITREQALLYAVQIDNFLMSEAGQAFNDDKEIVLLQVRQNGMLLSWVSERLRGDEEVVLAAIEENPEALEFASESLKNDPTFLRKCFEIRFYSYKYMTNPPSDLTIEWQSIVDCLAELNIDSFTFYKVSLAEIEEVIINLNINQQFIRRSMVEITNEIQESLLSGIPQRMSAFIQELLRQENNPCGLQAELPVNCFETTATVIGLDFPSEMYSPVEATVTATSIGFSVELMSGEELTALLQSANYNLEFEFSPFIILENDMGLFSVGFNNDVLSQMFESLNPGDVLLFGSYASSSETGRYATYTHSAIYLGEYDNTHYIFQKPDYHCGQVSPYEIVPLEDYLFDGLGQRVPLASFDTVFVYRHDR